MTDIKYCQNCGYLLQEIGKFCPECGSVLAEKSTDKKQPANYKREKVLKGSSKKSKNIYGLAAIVSMFAILIIYYLVQPSKESAVIKNQPQVTNSVSYPSSRYDHFYSIAFAKNGKIILPLDVVKEKKMMRFDYLVRGISFPLLAYLSEDGKIITAISMCEPCNSKEFHIKGSNLICNSCGTTWNLNDLEAISGSCSKYPPDPIPSKIVGNEIQIDENLVTGWKRRV
ncbi:MAG: Fe-S-containing protein [Bacteroidota bacterium]